MAGAKRRAQGEVSAAKLRQIHLATTLYRQDYDGDGVYGPISLMGLPDGLMVSRMLYGTERSRFHPLALWESGCGVHSPTLEGTFTWMPDDSEAWSVHAREFRDAMILAFDLNCNDANIAPENKYVTKLGIGVLLGGNIVRRRQTGDVYDPSWWAPVP